MPDQVPEAIAGDRANDEYSGLRRLYADYAPNYDGRFARYSERTLEEAERAIAICAPKRLLDVACGTGLLAERLRNRWPAIEIVGVDLSPEMLAQAARRLPESDGISTVPGDRADRVPLTSWRVGSAESLPVASAAFDCVVCTNAFHLVQHPVAALNEFRRALAPGGRLVILDWCTDFLSMRALLRGLRIARPQRRNVRTLDGLRDELRGAGFVLLEAWRFKIGPMWGLMAVVAARAEATGERAEEPAP